MRQWDLLITKGSRNYSDLASTSCVKEFLETPVRKLSLTTRSKRFNNCGVRYTVEGLEEIVCECTKCRAHDYFPLKAAWENESILEKQIPTQHARPATFLCRAVQRRAVDAYTLRVKGQRLSVPSKLLRLLLTSIPRRKKLVCCGPFRQMASYSSYCSRGLVILMRPTTMQGRVPKHSV